ncbi:uncharacterized protein METZ01_LOCUS149119, partial [marine metagenome]
VGSAVRIRSGQLKPGDSRGVAAAKPQGKTWMQHLKTNRGDQRNHLLLPRLGRPRTYELGVWSVGRRRKSLFM